MYTQVWKNGDTGKQGSRVGLTNYFVNTIVTALQSPEWDTLLQRIGLIAMLRLLGETSVFVSLPNGCFCQMTGQPIVSLRPPKVEPSEYVDPDPKEQQQYTRHLSKYVFPRQYGLKCPFVTTSTSKSLLDIADYTDREEEIKLQVAGDKLDASIILEYVSEQSILLSQAPSSLDNLSFDSNGNPIPPFGLTQARQHAKTKPRFADFSCPFIEVHRYVALVTKAVIPKAFWGNETNFRVIMKCVKEFIQCRRFETMSMHNILQGFSTSACEWLMPPGDPARKQTRVSVSDALKRRELLEEFIFWYFDSFVSSLLKANFYITDTSAFRNRVLYFRHDDWAFMCAPLIERLTTGTFSKMTSAEAEEVLRQRKLGFSFVRLLPKDTGVRPIVNLARRKTMLRNGQPTNLSINQVLQATFQILTYEKTNQSERLGASVFSPDDVYSKLKDFKSALPKNDDGTL
ncbi:hypothetical protein H0H92_015089 [Tricholoma furcatifolium]|nr:hypothetical protein H0H92_015089 [Tricholoma furcatifolium]